MDCAEIWFAVRDPASGDFAEAKGRMHLQMCTCKPSFSFGARSFIAEYGVLMVIFSVNMITQSYCVRILLVYNWHQTAKPYREYCTTIENEWDKENETESTKLLLAKAG